MPTKRILINKLNKFHDGISTEAIELSKHAQLGAIPPAHLPKIEQTLAQSTVLLSLMSNSMISGDIAYLKEMNEISLKALQKLKTINSIASKQKEND
jgi:hypothetical protein